MINLKITKLSILGKANNHKHCRCKGKESKDVI